MLTVAAGQDAALLCRAWCDLETTAETDCHHRDASGISTSVASGDTCVMVAFSGVWFLREEPRQGVSPPDAHHAILVPRYELAHLTSGDRPGPEPRPDWSPGQRTLPTLLRL